jgi:hypothetical protein
LYLKLERRRRRRRRGGGKRWVQREMGNGKWEMGIHTVLPLVSFSLVFSFVSLRSLVYVCTGGNGAYPAVLLVLGVGLGLELGLERALVSSVVCVALEPELEIEIDDGLDTVLLLLLLLLLCAEEEESMGQEDAVASV